LAGITFQRSFATFVVGNTRGVKAVQELLRHSLLFFSFVTFLVLFLPLQHAWIPNDLVKALVLLPLLPGESEDGGPRQ
jgi:hypothetical protein